MLDHEVVVKAILLPAGAVWFVTLLVLLWRGPKQPRLNELVVHVDGVDGRFADVIVRSADPADAERLAAGVARLVAEGGTVAAQIERGALPTQPPASRKPRPAT